MSYEVRNPASHQTLYAKIQAFYDASSGLWEEMWGEHMHHGFYGWDGSLKKERRQAQIDLIEELLEFAEIDRPLTSLLDVGCGIGGSTLYLAQKYQATAVGITLSPVQAQRAQERSQAAGFKNSVHFEVADALNLPFPAANFDLVWSLESGEHMPDKHQFLQEMHRVLKPQGIMILATWCHRPIESPDTPLTAEEQRHLKAIYHAYHLPYVISLSEYGDLARECGFQDLRMADWSKAVAPFWTVVMESALTLEGVLGLFRSGWQTIQGALAIVLMRQGYDQQLIRYGVLIARK